MAAMTSPQPDEVTVQQREVVKMAATSEEQPPTSNGVNGHPSPIATPPGIAADTSAIQQKTTSIADAPVVEQTKSSHIQNHDAFTSNQDIPEPPASSAQADPTPSAMDSAARDPAPATEEPSAGAEAPPAPPAPAVDGLETSKSEEPRSATTAEAPAVSREAAALDATSNSAPAEAQQDVEMADAQPPPASPAAEATAETTQITQVSDVPAASPAADVNLHPASMSSLAIDSSQDNQSAPVTADTSMADAPSQVSTKVARDRDEDDDDADEPLAKRTKTVVDEVLVDLPLAPGAEEAVAPAEEIGDEMVIDEPATAPPPRQRLHGAPGTLGDPAQESRAISGWANREIRRVLASVKKTKAGLNFKDPVKVKWPSLWVSYLEKISHPVDITSMEVQLRQDKYATLGDFINEVYLIRENTHIYNGPGHTVTAEAMSLVENIFTRLVEIMAEEPPKPEKREPKHIATRHAEPRAAATQARRESRGAATSPTEDIAESPVFAVPSSGVPLIRRDSTKYDGDRPKRPIHPPKSKDLGYEPKNLKKKKLSPEFRFCDEVLKELTKTKHWEFNRWFLSPVDPVKDNAPTYHKMIKKPMDLGTMQNKLNMGEYSSTKEFESDFQLIIKNCRKFNGSAMPSPHAGDLEELFRKKWAEKDEWMQTHSPAPAVSVSAASPSGAAEDDTEDEADAGEPEAEEEAVAETSEKLTALTARWNEERERLTQLIMAKLPDQTQIDTQNTIVNMFMTQIVEERLRLSSAPKKTKKAAKPKSSKPKKAAQVASSSGGKKAAGGGGKKGGAAAKKTAKRVMGQEEKGVVAEGINGLEGAQLEKAIDIIKKDTAQEESDNGELELDIDQLSQDALAKLYDLVVKAFPERKTARDKAQAAAPPPPEAAEAPLRQLPKAGGKPKKHKPMGKAEQERSIQKLAEIKAQFQGRPGSGSQEPLPSVEGVQPGAANDDSEDSDVDSEED